MQFIGRVAPSCICIDVVLDGIVSKLQYPMFCIKRPMNRVPICLKTLILGNKWRLCAVTYFLV